MRTGACLCGHVRYSLDGEPIMSALCHCPSCRRSAGAPVVAWAMFPRGALSFTGDPPAVFGSSAGVRRGFCSRCGTTLTFEADFIPDLVDVTIASLDEPDGLAPAMHIWRRHVIGWWPGAEGLEQHEELPPQALK